MGSKRYKDEWGALFDSCIKGVATMGKVVVIVGVFDEGSSNNGVARAFEQLGWDVKRVPYRELASAVGVDYASWGILNVVEVFKPNLVLFCKFNGFPSEVISKCTEKSKTCLWFMDSFNIIREQCPEIISHCHAASFSIMWPGVKSEFDKLNVPNVHGLVEGVSEEEFCPVKKENKYQSDVVFIGSKNWRHEYIEALEDAKFKVLTFGNGYNTVITGDKFNTVCSSAKFVLNVPTYPSKEKGYFGDRINRTLATGAASLTYYLLGLEDYYENGKHLVWFNGKEDFIEVVKDNIDKTDKIGSMGRKLFLSTHTCKGFVEKLLTFGNL